MIEQRDVAERELCVEECDECHVAPIIEGVPPGSEKRSTWPLYIHTDRWSAPQRMDVQRHSAPLRGGHMGCTNALRRRLASVDASAVVSLNAIFPWDRFLFVKTRRILTDPISGVRH